MPNWQDLENQMNQAGQGVTQGAQNAVNQGIDVPLQLKMQALQQQANPQAMPPQAPMPPPQAPPIPEVLPNPSNMSASDQTSRMNAQIQAPLTMQQVAAKLRQQADQDAADEAHANTIGENMTGYSDVNRAPAQAPPSRFQKLNKQIQAPPDVKAGTSPSKALTPEEEDEINKQLSGGGGLNQTGTLGGI